MASLVEVVDLLQSEPDKEIRIEGHTDSPGMQKPTLKFLRRANAVFSKHWLPWAWMQPVSPRPAWGRTFRSRPMTPMKAGPRTAGSM